MKYVPVIAKDGEQLMPTHPNKAGVLIKKKLATPFWKNGIFCIRLNFDPKDRYKQDIAIGIDPGSKKEGFTVKSEAHTYLNIQADAHTTTKKKVGKRSELRQSRRNRKCRGRKWRGNRNANKKRIPPSTMSRWSWKVRIVDFLRSIYPINCCVVEDVAAVTKKSQKSWNQSFSPLEVGKKWFYDQMEQRFWLFDVLKGFETKELREQYGLYKTDQKLSSVFEAHCVDSWVLATHAVGGSVPENREVFCIQPLSIQRRNLHREVPKKGGIRSRYGGTVCLGLQKMTLVKSIKYGLCWVSGYQKDKINLTTFKDGKKKQIPQQNKETFRVLKKLRFLYY